jgi:chromosome segregation ATPase
MDIDHLLTRLTHRVDDLNHAGKALISALRDIRDETLSCDAELQELRSKVHQLRAEKLKAEHELAVTLDEIGRAKAEIVKMADEALAIA